MRDWGMARWLRALGGRVRLERGGDAYTAQLDGDDWVITGTKNWISNAGVADFYIVFAVTNRDARRITAFVVEADRPGFSIGGYEHKLGIKAHPTGSPVLRNVGFRGKT